MLGLYMTDLKNLLVKWNFIPIKGVVGRGGSPDSAVKDLLKNFKNEVAYK